MLSVSHLHPASLSRAQGCLAGQIAGDSLGSLVEFQTAASISRRYPVGPCFLEDGGTWDTIAGQPTDDSELALALARSLALLGKYDVEDVARSYAKWYASGPFDIGRTTSAALSPAAAASRTGASAAGAARNAVDQKSQANGALMRISPLGIFGVRIPAADLVAFSRDDALLTHPHPVCQDSNVAYTAAIRYAIRTEASPAQIYAHTLEIAESNALDPTVRDRLSQAKSDAPADYERQQGWVLTAFQNAFYQLVNAPSLKKGVVDTVRCGGDTDTNAAIAGALLGAAYGIEMVPEQWLESILRCRPQSGLKEVRQPRPQEYWPVDVLTLAETLLGAEPFPD